MGLQAPPGARWEQPGLPRGRTRTGSFDLYAWFFMRLTGLLLIFLVLGHVLITHIINDVAVVNYAFVAQRWSTPFWRTYDWLMLVLALSHGVLGLRVVLDDYVHRPGWRILSFGALYSVGFVFALLGSLVILTFQPL